AIVRASRPAPTRPASREAQRESWTPRAGKADSRALRAAPSARRPAASPETVQKKYGEGRARTRQSNRGAQQLLRWLYSLPAGTRTSRLPLVCIAETRP